MNILLTVEELAKYLKIKPDTIYKKVRKGELPAIKLGKIVRFRKEQIDQWIVNHASRTLKDVKAARKAVEDTVEGAVDEVRKKAKVAKKLFEKDVQGVYQELKKAPLSKKQAILAKGLKAIWSDLSSELQAKAIRSTRRLKPKGVKKTQKKSQKSKTTIVGAAGPTVVAY